MFAQTLPMAERRDDPPPPRPPGRLTEFMWAMAANAGTLLAAVIAFIYARAAGFLQGVEINWRGVATTTAGIGFGLYVGWRILPRLMAGVAHRRHPRRRG